MITTESEPSLQVPFTFSLFDGNRRKTTGSISEVALLYKISIDAGATGPVLIFDNSTGRSIDVNVRGTDEDILQRYRPIEPESMPEPEHERAGKGRPKLGVVAREVTLLPRHWEWLGEQRGGASVALRRLVEEARKSEGDRAQTREAQERAYNFMSAMGGNFPGFEEASRALFANDREKLNAQIAEWPSDIREHLNLLLFGESKDSA